MLLWCRIYFFMIKHIVLEVGVSLLSRIIHHFVDYMFCLGRHPTCCVMQTGFSRFLIAPAKAISQVGKMQPMRNLHFCSPSVIHKSNGNHCNRVIINLM